MKLFKLLQKRVEIQRNIMKLNHSSLLRKIRPTPIEGIFNQLGADVLETIAPPPEGDNDLAESRRYLDRSVCSKGNLNLGLLRDGTSDQVASATCQMVEAVSGYAHIFSTADAVLPGTPPENLITFVRAIREKR